ALIVAGTHLVPSSRRMPAGFQKSLFVIDHRPDLGVQRLARWRTNSAELLLDLPLRIPCAPHGEDRVDRHIAAQLAYERRLLRSSEASGGLVGSTASRDEVAR